MRLAVPSVALVLALAGVVLAEDVTDGIGLELVQDGTTVPLDVRRTNRLLVPPQFAELEPTPFALHLPPTKCLGVERAVFVRVMPSEAMDAVVEQVYDTAFAADQEETLFPGGSGYAAYPDVAQTQMWMSPAAGQGDDWPYNYIIDDRFALRAAAGDRIDVSEVLDVQGEADWLADGRAFMMMIARLDCAELPNRLRIDLIGVSFLGRGT